MKLLASTKKDVDKDKNVENVPKLESVEVVLVHCNLVKNDYQHTSKVLFTFIPNKEFGQLIKKHETLTENPPVQIYRNKIKNRIIFKIKIGYKLELSTPETMKLLRSIKKDVDKDKIRICCGSFSPL